MAEEINYKELYMSKRLKTGAIVSLIGLVCLVCFLYYFYVYKPKLLFTLPATKCPEIVFHSYYTWGAQVNYLCRKQGFSSGPFFATYEVKAVKFRLSSGEYQLDFKEGEKGMVYFYEYHERNKKFVEQP